MPEHSFFAAINAELDDVLEELTTRKDATSELPAGQIINRYPMLTAQTPGWFAAPDALKGNDEINVVVRGINPESYAGRLDRGAQRKLAEALIKIRIIEHTITQSVTKTLPPGPTRHGGSVVRCPKCKSYYIE